MLIKLLELRIKNQITEETIILICTNIIYLETNLILGNTIY